jgi:hypothetical protein
MAVAQDARKAMGALKRSRHEGLIPQSSQNFIMMRLTPE